MSNLIKPYEISIWESTLVPKGEESEDRYFQEKKIAVIGSSTMTSPCKVYDSVLHKNKNGEKTLSFSIKSRYYDVDKQDFAENPFYPYLINERKVKLYYDNKWYEFIIKECTKSSEEYEWHYECQDAFVLELLKTGYSITFNSELGNNQGSATQLAAIALENTDWQIVNIDIDPPKINEPIYMAVLSRPDLLTIKNMDDDSDAQDLNSNIFVFYSYVSNGNGENVQFIEQAEHYDVDSNNNITATNYRIVDKLIFKEDGFYKIIKGGEGQEDTEVKVIALGQLYLDYQAYRILFQQLSTYDPVMGRTVDRYEAKDLNIYHYADYVYTSSNTVTSFVANGSDFKTYDSKKADYLQGWTRYTGAENNPELSVTTFPEDMHSDLIPLESLKQAEGYIETKFEISQNPSSLTQEGYLFNSGVENNAGMIGNIQKGEKFLFRWRAARADAILNESSRQLTELDPNHLGAVVGYYNKIDGNNIYRSYNELDTSKILLHFHPEQGEEAKILNNRLTSGHFTTAEGAPEGTKSFYIVDGVVQEPSTRYIYQEGENGTEYVWDKDGKEYIEKETASFFFDYYYLTAEATAAVTTEALRDSSTHIGIFFYINDGEDVASHYYYFQDLQLTRYYEDANGNPVVLGQAPTAKTTTTDYFYVAPELGTQKESVDTYASLAALAERLGIPESDITPVYTSDDIVFWTKDTENEEEPFLVKSDVELGARDIFYVKGYVLSKILSIEASKSNIFNILQTIAETFECWLDIEVFHNADGSIELDESKKPLKFIYLRRYAGKDNFAGFKYGINLKSVERIVDSNEVVTKLLVDDSQSDLVDSGFISIQKAESNISKEGYILNFDYFFNMKLLDRETVEKDYLALMEELKELNTELNELEKQKENLEGTLNKLSSNRNVYVNYLDSAKDALNRALDDFKRQSGGYEYEEYESLPQEEKDKILALLDNDTFMNTIGTIYNSAIVINNYAGLSGVNNEEYEEAVGDLYGQKDGHFTVTRVEDSTIGKHLIRLVLDDYIVPFKFKIDEEEYSTSINQKNFEIQVEESAIVTLTDFVYGDKYEGILNSQGEIVEEITPLELVTQNFTLKVKEEKPSLQDEIDELIEAKKKRIALFENKYSQYILEGNWSSNEYISDELYYLDALNLSRVSAFPKITYNISVVDISGIDEYSLYSFDAGDKTYIEDTEFFGWDTQKTPLSPAREEVIVSEIEWHLDDPSSNSITVQNYKTNFEDLFQRIQATVQTVQYNETTYPKTSSFIGEDGHIIESVLLDSLNNISGRKYNLTSDGSVYIDGGTILVRNLTNATNCVKINSEGIQITSDGGTTWSTAVSGQGIDIGKVFAGSINTKEIFIGNPDNASFFWDSNGINAYQLDTATEKYDHNTYVRFDEYGLYGIEKGTSLKLNSIEEVKEKANFGLTWDGFFIKSTHEGGGQVKISKEDDIEVIDGQEHKRVKIGYIKEENRYGIVLRNSSDKKTLWTDDEGNITLTGTIQSDNYSQDKLTGWQINQSGDATFNNVSVRGAIKTAVFEYSEVQAVGGIFLFRPSSSITAAKVEEDDLAPGTYNLKVKVDKPTQFESGDWCKISNYTKEVQTQSIIEDSGLVYIYRFDSIEDGFLVFKDVDTELKDKVESLIGGALISMGKEDGTDNYGIGINSSDSAVNLSPRAISLFETVIYPDESIKVSYALRGILGTLPEISELKRPIGDLTNSYLYDDYMVGTQGIYTDNMYIGNKNQYITFYTDKQLNPQKHLEIESSNLRLNDQGAYIKGEVQALSLTIGEGDDEYDGISAINASGYTIEIIRDDTAMPGYNPDAIPPIVPPDGTTYIYPILYHNGVKAEEYILTEDIEVKSGTIYYVRSSSDPYIYTEVTNPTGNPKAQGWYQKRKFVWYEENSESGIVGDELHGGMFAIYDKSYRVTYTFTDDEVGEAPTVQTVTVDPSKYITKINDRGIIIHPEKWQGESSYILLDGSGLELRDINNKSLAKYGITARIGQVESSRFLMNNNSLEAYDNYNSKYFEVSSNVLRWGNNTAATVANVDAAALVATNYITDITDKGITIHPEDTSDNNFLRINSDGINVVKNGIVLASYGENVTIGDTDKTHTMINYHSMQLKDKEGNTYFHISDLRNEQGEVERILTYIGDGQNTWYTIQPPAKDANYTVTVSDSSGEGFKNKETNFLNFNSPPTDGAIITITYISNAVSNKAYTIGVRKEGSYLGSYSYAEGSGVEASEYCSHAEGLETIASGRHAHAEGSMTIASGNSAHSEGGSTKAIASDSHAEGNFSEANGPCSHAEGFYTRADGFKSHAEGEYTHATGENSHTEGMYTYATNKDTHAEGRETRATGEETHAEGYKTQANGDCSHAEGELSIASGYASHAEGTLCEASGDYSHAGGQWTKAQGFCQTAIGFCNEASGHASELEYDENDNVFIVGNGRHDVSRSNALELTFAGDLFIAGTLYQASDRRIKEHISYLNENEKANQFIRSLKPANFIKNKKSHVGFYAQDVEENDKWHCMTGELNGFKTLDYNEIIAPLVAYCQHLEKRIEELEGGGN